MNFGEFLYIHPDNIKKQVWNIENLEKKLANARFAIFLIKPVYIYIAHVAHISKKERHILQSLWKYIYI